MIPVTTPIKDDLLDACRPRSLGKDFPYDRSLISLFLAFCRGLHFGVQRAGRHQSMVLSIVYDLSVDMPQTAKHAQTGALRRTLNLPSHPRMTALTRKTPFFRLVHKSS
jgi:hypothetical protein